jgi:hypothetical protein
MAKETSQNILCNSKIISEELHKSALASYIPIIEHRGNIVIYIQLENIHPYDKMK